MRYKVMFGRPRYFETLEEAMRCANEHLARTGDFVEIREVSRRALSYEEFIALAREHYSSGGDVAVECWDERCFDDYVEMFGPVTRTRALRMFRAWRSEAEEMAAMAGW